MDDVILRNRKLLRDFTTTTLASIPNMFGRLAYLASLRDLSSGKYAHEGLAAVYSAESIQEVLQYCHREIFLKILETPLSVQESDLRQCLEGMSGPFAITVAHWRQLESYRILPPEGEPDYLRELFFSNLSAILEVLAAEDSKAHSDA